MAKQECTLVRVSESPVRFFDGHYSLTLDSNWGVIAALDHAPIKCFIAGSMFPGNLFMIKADDGFADPRVKRVHDIMENPTCKQFQCLCAGSQVTLVWDNMEQSA